MTRTSKQLRLTNPPEALALLGKAIALGVGSGEELKIGRGFFVAADPNGGLLIIGPDDLAMDVSTRGPDNPSRRAARAVREKFHGSLDGREWEIRNFPRSWRHLGAARTIVYESDKTNGGGTGKPEHFIHEFSPGANAYSAGDFLAIVGEKIRVDASGVRN